MATSAPQPQGALTAQERAQRSVFVGNIPYEAGEDQLKEIFTQAGPVVSFRIVYDRETGKPKGYGFCEYQDVETAQSAMRNLNNYDFHGRPLRVGVAAGEQSKDDRSMQQALGGPMIESPYGDPVESEKAPEAISKAVASLPPEQMFELMKQMKMCIQNNPNEARNMLLQNPQLAYALLQAQIVMKIVDPNVALAMLHRQTEQIPPLVPSAGDGPRPQSQLLDFPGISASTSGMPPASSAPVTSLGGPRGPPPMSSGPAMSGRGPPPISSGPPTSMGGPGPIRGPRPEFGGPGGPGGRMPERGPVPMDQGPPPRGPPRPSGGLLGDRPGFAGDMGGGPPGRPGPPQDRFPQDRDLRVPPGGPGLPGLGGPPPSSMAGRGPPPSSQAGPPGGRDPRAERDPRSQRGGPGPMGPGPGGPPPGRPGPPSGGPGLGNSLAGLGNMGGGTGAPGQDQEKAALIMQVLQLSDEQIAMLPPDQRRSILILKEQIARSSSN